MLRANNIRELHGRTFFRHRDGRTSINSAHFAAPRHGITRGQPYANFLLYASLDPTICPYENGKARRFPLSSPEI